MHLFIHSLTHSFNKSVSPYSARSYLVSGPRQHLENNGKQDKHIVFPLLELIFQWQAPGGHV